jgi:protein-glutamine gamma-glutamyltransferase
MKLTRPTLYSLALTLFLVSAPHVQHLPLWVSALAATLLLWRAYLAYRHAPLPSRWLLMPLTLACVAAIGMSFHTLFGREVGVTLLVLLAALKLLEVHNARDAMAVIYLACFLIITNFFYSQSIATAALMCATLLVIVATWLRIQAPQIAFQAQLRLASVMLLQAAPLMLIAFVLFPRIQGPLWGMPQDAYSSSGLSERMEPGSLSKLTLSEAVAFRVTYANQVPRREQMYWRGPVLWNFDGRVWTTGASGFNSPAQFSDAAQPVEYSVTLEPHNKKWLYGLDVPSSLPPNALMNDDFQVFSKDSIVARTRYTMRSNLSYRANLDEPESQRQRGLQLPAQLNPRARQLAATWRTQSANDAAIVNTALRYFNQEKFSYTLEPPLLGRDGIDEFLFSTQQGFCEHYAAAFVYLMRAANIPARVVTGYQGGEYNKIGNYYIVRQSDAHAWAEVWLTGSGWVRVDPTAAIAPERVQKNLSAALSDNSALGFMARNPPQWLLNLRMNLDAVSNQWNQWLIGYDTEKQFALLTRLGMTEVSWESLARQLMLALSIVIGALSLWLMRHLWVRERDPVQAAWLKFCKHMARAGLPRTAPEAALDYVSRISTHYPHQRAALFAIAQRYNELRYGMNNTELRAFQHAVRAFKL